MYINIVFIRSASPTCCVCTLILDGKLAPVEHRVRALGVGHLRRYFIGHLKPRPVPLHANEVPAQTQATTFTNAFKPFYVFVF